MHTFRNERENEEPIIFQWKDKHPFCQNCQIEFDEIPCNELLAREVSSHTLQHGTVQITVMDAICVNCSSIIPTME